ncbi:superoxide dismutase[Cu-Zn] [Mycolicibacterium palauense]|uniref:superoxide dismutase[Cu-Zn] n=1 Tax=Mycolicibacterium palauense TaxID=2034511 RepID=UPI000BFEF695|nr:superoxide dismutase family protein [Mycolicibacterium palauense]
MVSAATLRAVTVTALFATPVALLSACAPPGQVPATTPGTTPAIWTGSPAPEPAEGMEGTEETGQETQVSESGTLEVPMMNPSGQQVATATFEFSESYATVTVETTGPGKLEPGFHGMHIHTVGKCEANSVAPDGGAPGNFLSAGGHWNAPGTQASGAAMSGQLPPLLVREDGSGMLVTETDRFTEEDLQAGNGTAIMIHSGPDNFANIPEERYNQVNGTPGPDQSTLATGDAGSRVACGVISGS